MVSVRLKQAVLGTFMEPLARCYAHRVRPLLKTAEHPELALLHQETRFILRAIDKLTDNRSNCVDVGSHIGLILSEFLRRAPQGKHICIEPTPQKAELLRRKFPQAEIHECALADYSGVADFHENVVDTAASALGAVRSSNGHGGGDDGIRKYDVAVKRLDEIVPTDRRISLIKIDSEGAELLVLKGAPDLIARDRPAIIFECGVDHRVSDRPGDALYSFFADAEYSVHTVVSFVFTGAPLSRDVFNFVRTYPPTAFNFVALPKR
jgi:FkbM family methyltransferase